MNINNPLQVYSFTTFSQQKPNAQQPGDRLDAQFANHHNVLNQIIATLTALASRMVTSSDLSPVLFDKLTATLQQAIRSDTLAAANSAVQTHIDVLSSANSALIAASAASKADSALAVVLANKDAAANSLAETFHTVIDLGSRTIQIAQQSANDANDAALQSALASDYALVCQAWAEYMPTTIPPNILSIMGVTGDHWSSRWWANQAVQTGTTIQGYLNQVLSAAQQVHTDAAQVASDLDTITQLSTEFFAYYLGAFTADPTLDNNGQSLKNGALYFNTASNTMRVYSFPTWQNINASTTMGIPEAPLDTYLYGRHNGTWTQVSGPSQPGIPDAPSDGTQYSRQSGQWTRTIVGATAWADITGKPTTFPPSPHTHPISDVINLQSTLDAESSARQSADTALTNAQMLKAPLASPTFTGAVNIPTPAPGDSSTLAASTAFVTPQLNLKAPLAAPAFTGAATFTSPGASVAVPTQNPGDSSPNAASTSFVTSAITALSSVKIALSTNPPTPAKLNDLWWQSDTGRLYVYYNDGNSVQWVGINPGALANVLNSLASIGPTLQLGDLLLASAADTLGRIPATPPAAGEPNRLLTLTSGGAVSWTDARAQLKTRYLNPGSFSHPKAPGATRCDLYIQGASGAGPAGQSWGTGNVSLSSGGGLGAFTIKRNYLHGATMALIVGAGNLTTTGGTSSADAITALGGAPGTIATGVNTSNQACGGGAGGAAGSTGDENYPGQGGAAVTYVNASAGGQGFVYPSPSSFYRDVQRIGCPGAVLGTANVPARQGPNGFIEVVEYFD